MRLVRRWRSLQDGNDPFVELYRAAVFQPDLPPRARFLHLIQALEARHSYANRVADERAQAKFAVKREQIVQAATSVGLTGSDLQFLKDRWSKRMPDSLDRRLHALLNELPATTVSAMDSSTELDPVRASLLTADPNATKLHSQLRVLRNQLSHGGHNYPDHELRPWVRVVETIARGQLLGLLGFTPAAIEKALRTG